MKFQTMTSDRVPLKVEIVLKGEYTDPVLQNRMVADAIHRFTFFEGVDAIERSWENFENLVSLDSGQVFTLIHLEPGEQEGYLRYLDHLNQLLDHNIIAPDQYRDRALELLRDVSASWKLAYVIGMMMTVTYTKLTVEEAKKPRALRFLLPMWLRVYNYLVHDVDMSGLSASVDRAQDELPGNAESHLDIMSRQHIAAASFLVKKERFN